MSVIAIQGPLLIVFPAPLAALTWLLGFPTLLMLAKKKFSKKESLIWIYQGLNP